MRISSDRLCPSQEYEIASHSRTGASVVVQSGSTFVTWRLPVIGRYFLLHQPQELESGHLSYSPEDCISRHWLWCRGCEVIAEFLIHDCRIKSYIAET
jgi:hypothetical protein